MEAKQSSISPHMIKRMTDSHQTKMTNSSGGYAKNNSSIYSTGNNRMGLTSPSPPPQSMIAAAAVAVAQHQHQSPKPNQVSTVLLHGIPIVSLYIESKERLCLAQISNTLLKQFSYNEIHNRRVALGITCVQCTPVQLEILRRAGAMPVSSRRCGMITRREAERLCKSFLGDNAPPRLPDDFAFNVLHECAWGCRGSFLPSRYNSSRAKCIKCYYCGLFFSPNKFIFHSHRIGPTDKYVQPDAANFNSWRRHLKLSGTPDDFIVHSWEDVKAMFNGGTRKRMMVQSPISRAQTPSSPKKIKETPTMSPPHLTNSVASPKIPSTNHLPIRPTNVHKSTGAALHTGPTGSNNTSVRNVMPQVFQSDLPLPFSRSFMDYMWHQHQNPQKAATAASLIQFPSYALPWLKRPATGLFPHHQPPPSMTVDQPPLSNGATNLDPSKQLGFYNNSSAFKPVLSLRKEEDIIKPPTHIKHYADISDEESEIRTTGKPCPPPVFKESHSSDDEMVDIETTDDDYCEPTTTTKAVPVDIVRGGTPLGNNNNDSYCRMTDSPVDSSTALRQHDEKQGRCCNDEEPIAEKHERRCNEYSEENDQEPIALKTANHSPIINLSSFTSSEISSLSSTSPSSTVSSSSSIANRKHFNNNNKNSFNNNNGVPSAPIPTTVSGQLWSVANLAHSNHPQLRPTLENDENNSFGMLNARCLSAASFYRHQHHSPPLSDSFLLKNFSAQLQHRHSESDSPPHPTQPPLPNSQTYI